MADEIVLLRHGEVDNPRGVVYASLPGFALTSAGAGEAAAAGEHLRHRDVVAVVASPLLRAQQTAAAIADPRGLDVGTDERLVEWGLLDRWAGVRWAALDEAYPGEPAAYWADPADLPFSPESLTALAARMTAAAVDADQGHASGTVVLVSHQDPVQAGRLALTGRPLDGLHADKPQHAGAVTLRPLSSGAGRGWEEWEHWHPGADGDGP